MDAAPPAPFAAARPGPPLRVAVLVDLARGAGAGGHVKCWERLAEAAAAHADALDLSIHTLGDPPAVEALAPNVRFVAHRAAFGTWRLRFLGTIPAHTDLAFHHRGLAAALASADLIHTTEAHFAFARTAERVARRRGVPLVHSTHTEIGRSVALAVDRLLRRAAGEGGFGRLLTRWIDLPGLAERAAERRLKHHFARCAAVLVSRPDQAAQVAAVLPAGRIGTMRRGVDLRRFHPDLRDPERMRAELAIPPGSSSVLCVGRLEAGKNVTVLARAVRLLRDAGRPVVLICAGAGPDAAEVQACLGAGVRLPGVLDADRLARLYASVDAVAHPSEIEVFANVAMEAMAAGRPVLVSAQGGMGRLLEGGRAGIEVVGGTPADWARMLAPVLDDPDHAEALGRAARATAERTFPSWDDVLCQDLLPIWRGVAAAGEAQRSAGGFPWSTWRATSAAESSS